MAALARTLAMGAHSLYTQMYVHYFCLYFRLYTLNPPLHNSVFRFFAAFPFFFFFPFPWLPP